MKWLLEKVDSGWADFIGNRYEKQVRKGFRWLIFQPELEKEFKAYLKAYSVTMRRAGFALAAVLWTASLVADYCLYTDRPEYKILFFTLLFIQGSMALIAVIGLFVFSRPHRQAFADTYITLCLVAFNLALAVCSILLERYIGTGFFHFAMMIGILAILFPLGLTFWEAIRLMFFCLFIHVLGFFISNGLTFFVDDLSEILFYSMLIMACLFALYFHDYTLRKQFIIQGVLGLMAKNDGLTGLLNRRHFESLAEQNLVLAQKEAKQIALLLVDIDNFKSFNDCYGHPVGDEVLRAVGCLLQRYVRGPHDIAGRLGGEEFAVMLYDVDRDSVLALADLLRLEVEQLDIENKRACYGKLTISLGLAFSKPEDSLETLYTQSDRALYQAKSRGRNRICFNESMVDVSGGGVPNEKSAWKQALYR